MDYSQRLSVSYYRTIATLNESHKIYLVQHQETGKIYVKKILDVFNEDVYEYLSKIPIVGIPHIADMCREDDQLIIVEDYVSGHSLQELMDTSSLTIESIFQYMTGLCAILGRLHYLTPPIIHRDIKPSNIIITEYNHVMLLDFNAAKFLSYTDSSDTVLLGTQGYAAPEQYGFGSSTPRTDIYALGILLKELQAALPIRTHIFDPIIAKCSQINPADRYDSVFQLQAALEMLRNPIPVDSDVNASGSVQVSEQPRHTKLTLRDFIPPGFRTRKIGKMILATLGYLFLFWLSLGTNVEGASGGALWIYRLSFLGVFLSIVFACFNYMDIRRFFPLCKHRNRLLRYLGVVFMIFVLFLFCGVTAAILLSIFYPNVPYSS